MWSLGVSRADHRIQDDPLDQFSLSVKIRRPEVGVASVGWLAERRSREKAGESTIVSADASWFVLGLSGVHTPRAKEYSR